MSASAWDRAIEAAAAANGQTEPLAARYRESIEQALAAALPVLLEELTRHIEEVRDSREHFEHCSLTQAAGIVRGFAAEVTQ